FGSSWVNLNSPLITVSAIGLAQYQGDFVADPAFTQVVDQGRNTYDPDTIYITDGSTVEVTKNHGVTWVARTPGGTGPIQDIEVDPTNRDTVYAVRSGFDGAGRKVYKSTDAGRTWTDLTRNLPDQPVWKLVLVPRTHAHYVVTEHGVWH